MPIRSPFHDRVAPFCTSYAWKQWAGYYAVSHFGESHLPEYWAFREASAITDITPLFKYVVQGRDAARLLSRMAVRGFAKLPIGSVAYTCWCDANGKVIDDGTVSRLGEDRFFLTAAEPTLSWLTRLGRGLEVELADVSETISALSLQGPTSREVLRQCSDANVDRLGFFQTASAKLDGVEVQISRTGYSGDLGYELWCDARDSLRVWDALMAAGRSYGIEPAGIEALDMARIEAGFIMLGVDYYSAPRVTIAARRSSPYEIGLERCVKLDRGAFMGQEALRAEAARGPEWKLVGIEADWAELEQLYESYDLPPALAPAASRASVPLYSDRKFVGQVTSTVWSPLLKRYIALASVKAPFAALGTKLELEHTALYERRTVSARVVERPFFDPERKRMP
ncbi:MAG TPA: aminomethyltransferase family protein [Myxococcota bacterium]|nr:aminomethyltransferase family protein [Myxococcota bacterium]